MIWNPLNGQTPRSRPDSTFPVTVRSVDNYYNLVQPNAKVQLATPRIRSWPSGGAASAQRAARRCSPSLCRPPIKRRAGPSPRQRHPGLDHESHFQRHLRRACEIWNAKIQSCNWFCPAKRRCRGRPPTARKEKWDCRRTPPRGVQYPVVIHLTDAFYNVVTGGAMPTVQLTSTDPFDDETSYFGGNPQSLDPVTAKARTSACSSTQVRAGH